MPKKPWWVSEKKWRTMIAASLGDEGAMEKVARMTTGISGIPKLSVEDQKEMLARRIARASGNPIVLADIGECPHEVHHRAPVVSAGGQIGIMCLRCGLIGSRRTPSDNPE